MTACLTCDTTRYLDSRIFIYTCLTVCPAGYWGNNSTRKCNNYINFKYKFYFYFFKSYFIK